MDKEKTIQIIKERIISEHRKHKDLDWEEIAARKIYASLVKLFAIHDVSNSLDLRELERKLDEALGKETRETLTEWLKQQRQ